MSDYDTYAENSYTWTVFDADQQEVPSYVIRERFIEYIKPTITGVRSKIISENKIVVGNKTNEEK